MDSVPRAGIGLQLTQSHNSQQKYSCAGENRRTNQSVYHHPVKHRLSPAYCQMHRSCQSGFLRESVRGSYYSEGSDCCLLRQSPQSRSCCIHRVTYEGQFSMMMFFEFAEHRNTIASRSTKVTFARSRATVGALSSAIARSSSGTYSFVN